MVPVGRYFIDNNVGLVGLIPIAPKGQKLEKIANELDCTPAQVAIKFCYDEGCITIPKSSNPDRIIENINSLNVLADAHIQKIDWMSEKLLPCPKQFMEQRSVRSIDHSNVPTLDCSNAQTFEHSKV